MSKTEFRRFFVDSKKRWYNSVLSNGTNLRVISRCKQIIEYFLLKMKIIEEKYMRACIISKGPWPEMVLLGFSREHSFSWKYKLFWWILSRWLKRNYHFRYGWKPPRYSDKRSGSELGYELFPHPSYWSDVAHSHYFLFSNMKKKLFGKKIFKEDVIAETSDWRVAPMVLFWKDTKDRKTLEKIFCCQDLSNSTCTFADTTSWYHQFIISTFFWELFQIFSNSSSNDMNEKSKIKSFQRIRDEIFNIFRKVVLQS